VVMGKMSARPTRVIVWVLALTLVVVVSLSVRAQTTPPASEAPTSIVTETQTPAAQIAEPAPAIETPPAGKPGPQVPPILHAEQLDQLLAPIALYPDTLLAQILMAANYPLEIVKANRWFQDPRHAALSGDQLAAALEAETWDPSVKALVTVPQILMMMDANLDWTEELGDALVAQQADVMDAIQRLRHQAAAAGTLWSNAEQNVTEEGQGIAIEPANPAYIYPPLYNPALVYGPWPSPEFPPLDIAPPDYGVGFGLPFGISFGAGFVVVNKIWPWCAFDWGQRRIRRNVQASKALDHATLGSEAAIWRHDPARRLGVASFDFGSRARLAMFRNRPVPVVSIPRMPAPRLASGPPMVFPRSAPRAFTPVRVGPAVTPARIGPGTLTLPERRLAGRPMMMPQMAPRQPAMWSMPRAAAPLRSAPAGGGAHSDGASHR
jgi:hypothetical protein